MTYEKLFQMLQGKQPMSGSLNKVNYVTKDHMAQHVTVYDSNSDEYYQVSLMLSKDSAVVDDGQLILVTKDDYEKIGPHLCDELDNFNEWETEHDWS
jgi:hypothetical protein